MAKREKDAKIIPLFPDFREERKPKAPTRTAEPTSRLWTLVCLELDDPGGPRALLWVDDASTQVLTAAVGRIPELVEPALDGLDELFEAADEAGVATPRRVLVPTPELLDALGPALAERLDEPVEIEIGISPRLEEQLAAFANEMDSSFGSEELFFQLLDELDAEFDPEVSYFGPEPVPLETIEALFEAAKALRRRKPTRYLHEIDAIAVELPALELDDGALLVTEHEGRPVLSIFSCFADLVEEVESEPVEELINDTEADPLDNFNVLAESGPELQLVFVNKAELSAELVDELDRMPFAPKRGPYPLPVAFDAEGELRPMHERDYLVLTTVADALAKLLTPKRAEAWRDQREPLQADFSVNYGGVESEGRLLLPHPELAIEDAEDPEDSASPATRTRYRLKITLRHTRPPIWRRVEVDAATTLAELHTIIQVAMGWENHHLYEFEHKKRRYGPSGDFGELDDARVRLADLELRKRSKLHYTYDFGDGWEHEIRVEAVDKEAQAERPRCIEGRRACPPEDCGGYWGYEQLLDDSNFDADAFSAERADARLARVFKRRR